jgi:hypothetical protein
MQAHPDRAELKAYLRGRLQSAEAGAIKAHLLTCDQCVSDAVLECDYLDQMRARFAQRSKRDYDTIQVLTPLPQPAALALSSDSGIHHAWAALIPMTLAVGFLFSTRALQERPSAIVQARTSQSIEQTTFTPLPAIQGEASGTPEESSNEADVDNDQPAEVRRTPTRPSGNRQQTHIRRAFILAHYALQARPPKHPVLLGPAEFDRPVIMSSVSFRQSEALSLATTEPYLSPPPRRKNGLRRFFSAFAAPFRS